MKNYIFLIFATTLLLFSCTSEKKILYLQDTYPNQEIGAQELQTIKLLPGDRVSVLVTSSATPQIALQFNLPILTVSAATGTKSSGSNQMALYTIDENGCIDIPTLGRVQVGGMTRSEAGAKIQSMLREELLRDAVVTLSSYDQYITVLGEVKTPGRISISRDNITLLEAIGQAGDLTIQGRRDQVKVLRQENGTVKTYYVDLRSSDLFKSPVYNLKQNDVIYVSPNRMRAGQSTTNDNSLRTISTWISIASFLTTLGVLIFD